MHTVGTSHNNIGAPNRVMRSGNRLDLNPELFPHFRRECLSVGGSAAIDLDCVDVAHLHQRFQRGARHAPRTDYTDRMGILARQ